MRAHPFRTEGGAPTTKPISTPTRRSTRPGCEDVPAPFAPRRCSANKTKPNSDPKEHTRRVRIRARRFVPRRCSDGVRPLQPHRIPMRIIPHRLHQPRPDRVGYDISGQRLEVILPAHRSIMKTPLPYTPPDPPRTNTPHPPHHSAERLVIQLHQPMEMIRH